MSPLNIKLADFGLAKSTSRDASSMKTMIGTCNYMALGVLELTAYRKAGMSYTQAVDMWALGVLTHELYTGKIRNRRRE
jgi:serine/threonine protein kinase